VGEELFTQRGGKPEFHSAYVPPAACWALRGGSAVAVATGSCAEPDTVAAQSGTGIDVRCQTGDENRSDWWAGCGSRGITVQNSIFRFVGGDGGGEAKAEAIKRFPETKHCRTRGHIAVRQIFADERCSEAVVS